MELKRMAERLNNVSFRKEAKQLLAVTLAVLMVIPVTGYGVVAHAQETKTITAFADLAGEVKTITVPTGTLEGELPLPKTVTATVERTVYEETTTDSNATPNGSEGGSAEGTEPKTEPVAKKVTEDVALAVTWESDKPFSSETADTFTYTANVTEESYPLAAGVSLPKIQVTIADSGTGMFNQSKTIGGIEITVNAEKGVFPEGAVLHAEKVTEVEDKAKIENLISKEVKATDAAKIVMQVVSFDITITDADGNELQPDTSKGEVKVSFAQLSMTENKNVTENHDIQVFHMNDTLSSAEELESSVDDKGVVKALAEHFSVYAITETTVTPDTNTMTTLYIDKGNITIGEGTVSGFDATGTEVTTANANGYMITRTDMYSSVNKYTITVSSGTHNIVLKDVRFYLDPTISSSPFSIASGAKANLILEGTNVLQTRCDLTPAGLHVPEGAELVIAQGSTGSISAYGGPGAGIGGNVNETGGTITINGGTLTYVSGGTSGAGIGGGRGGAGGSITINGGILTDVRSSTGAGIGGGAEGGAGGTITIHGGTINAQSDLGGAGIGGGENGDGGSITINGGIVKATAGSSGAGIGGGGYGDGGTINITNGEVTATSSFGAGIGGGAYTYGNDHTGGTITISGGTVSANTTNIDGVGIGNGFRGGNQGGILSSGGNSVYVIANRVNADTASFNGVIENNGNTSVYGSYTLTGDMTIAPGKTMTIPSGSSLIVPSDKKLTVNGTLTNNGTLSLGAESCLTGTDNTLSGEGTFKTVGDPSSDMIVVPTNLIYTGTDLAETAKSAISIDTTKVGTGKILNREFQVIANSTDGWVLSISPAVVKETGTYTAAFTKDGKTINKEFTVTQSATSFDGGITVDKIDKTYTYGDIISVTVKPKATGTAPQVRMAFVAPTAKQMALFVGDTQISDPVDGDSNGVYTMTYNTAGKALSIGSNTITAKYVGNANMADFSADVSITLNKKALTVENSTQSFPYNGRPLFNLTLSKLSDFNGLLAGDKIGYPSVQGTLSDANVGTNKNHTVTQVDLKSDYYSLAASDVHMNITISKRLLTSDMMSNINDASYNGTQHKPIPTVTDGTPSIIKESDYTVSYGENINVGFGRVTITAAESGNYTGTTYQDFTIKKAVPTITLKLAVRDDDPFVYGNQMYITATVTGANGDYPDGTVTFMDGDNVLFSDVPFDKYAKFYQKGSYDVPAGTHSFTAVYNPGIDGTGKNYESAVSTVVEQAIAKADQSAFGITEITGQKYGDGEFALSTAGGNGSGDVTYSVPANNGVLLITTGNMATIIGAGKVTVTATKAGDNNYNSTSATREITIAKAAAPAIDFPTANGITYGQKLSASTLTGGSTEFGSFAWADGNTVPTVTNSGYTVNFTASEETIKNYETITPTTSTVAVTVAKETPAVSVSATVSGETGSRQAALTATVATVGEGILPTGTVKFVDSTSGSDVDIAGGTVSITNGVASYTWSGLSDQVYKVKAVYAGDPNYETATSSEIAFDTRKQAQQNFALSVIGTKTYGDGAFTLSTTGGNGMGAVSFTSSDTSVVRIDGTKATILKAGIAKITATKAMDSTYNEVVAEVSIPVAKKDLNVTAENKTVVKGKAMPTFTYQANGLVNGDTFITEPSMKTKATNTNTVGEYDILISGGTLANADSYAVTYTNSKLTVVNAVCTVTVTNGTGGGSYSEGQTVTITADSRSGYTFTGWSSSDGVTLASSTASTTTFTMPGKAITVTANYSKNSSGGSSGGGSSSGGGGGSVTTPDTSTDSSKPTTNGNTTSVSTKTKANMSGSTANATVSESSMNTAIDSAITAATKANGNANVTVAVEAATDAKTIKASIPAASMTKLAENKIEASLTVETGLGTITLDSSVVDTISKQANGKPVSVEIATVDNKTLSAEQQAIVGDRPVIDLSIVADGKNVSQLGGSATISIPYTPANGEDTSKMVVWYLADNGDLILIDCSYSNGKRSFTTNHFSKYVLASYTFTDAKGDEWYYSAVKTMQDQGLMNGLSSDTFGANMSTNRAMIVTMLYRLAGKPAASATSVYTDVSADAYYGNAVKWAAEKSIVKGMSAETFAPSMSISREQIVTILYRYAGSPAIAGSELSKFADASSVSYYATDAFAWAIQAGVIKGDDNGLLNPTMGATRAEVATLFSNYLKIGK